MLLRRIALALPLLALGACASQPDKPQVQAQADPQQNCQVTYQTGSMLPRRVCAPAPTAEDRERIDDLQRAAATRVAGPMTK